MTQVRPSTQIAQEGALDGQALEWSDTVGGWVPNDVSGGGGGDTSWTTVASFSNGYASAGGGNWPAPSFRKLAGGLVVMRGLVDTSAGTVNTSMFTLPTDYRPGFYQEYVVGGDISASPFHSYGFVTVRSTGDVFLLDPKPDVDIDLSKISFFAE